MQQGDKVRVEGKEWVGRAVWVDNVEKKVGVVYISPSVYFGGSNTYDESELVVVNSVRDVQSRLERMSVEELRAEIDELRNDRKTRVIRPSKRKVYRKKEPSELSKLVKLIDKYGAEKVRKIVKEANASD